LAWSYLYLFWMLLPSFIKIYSCPLWD
jgi:hypothetical protein